MTNNARREGLYSRAGLFKRLRRLMAMYGKKAGGQEEDAMVMKLSECDKRQAWAFSSFIFEDFELNLKPVRKQTEEEESGMIEGGGNAEIENNEWKNGWEFKSLSRRNGLNGDCFEAPCIKSQALFIQLPGRPLRLWKVYESEMNTAISLAWR